MQPCRTTVTWLRTAQRPIEPGKGTNRFSAPGKAGRMAAEQLSPVRWGARLRTRQLA